MSYDRSSHKTFLEDRDWNLVSQFWSQIVGDSSCNHNDLFPAFQGDQKFGITNLKEIHELGRNEYFSSDPRYKRKTFAMRIGYDGVHYHGYQLQHSSGTKSSVKRQKKKNKKKHVDENIQMPSTLSPPNKALFSESQHTMEYQRDSTASTSNENCFKIKHHKDIHTMSTTINTSIENNSSNSICNLNNALVKTVEGDLFTALQRTCVAAGRTDRDVSAISQIISFSTYDEVTPESLMKQILETESCTQLHCLNAYECVRVPKRFHSLFSATWRRYLFLFPLNFGQFPLIDIHHPHTLINNNNSRSSNSNESNDKNLIYGDINIQLVNKLLNRLENKILPYNSYAFRHDRSSSSSSSSSSSNSNSNENDSSSDICCLYVARAYPISLSTNNNYNNHQSYNTNDMSNNHSDNITDKSIPYAMCVELVGDRFLRRMVRILVATVVRASLLHPDLSNSDSNINVNNDDIDNILVNIAIQGDRNQASVAVDGRGLCLAGVGYDISDLKINKISGKNGKSKTFAESGNNKFNSIDNKMKIADGSFCMMDDDSDDDNNNIDIDNNDID